MSIIRGLSAAAGALTLHGMKRFMMMLVVALSLAAITFAQDTKQQQPAKAADAPAAKAQEPAPAPAQPQPQPSAEDVLNELLRRRSENPLIEPAPAPGTPGTPGKAAPGAATGPASAARPLGTAPAVGAGAPLRREGQFIINRRARMVRPAGDSAAWLLVFDADASGLGDPPMYMMPCKLLEDAEAIAQQRGGEAVFTASGQVFVYRGANYFLPTIMKEAADRGNLKP